MDYKPDIYKKGLLVKNLGCCPRAMKPVNIKSEKMVGTSTSSTEIINT